MSSKAEPKNLGVEKSQLKETLIGSLLFTRLMVSVNRVELIGDKDEDDYLESLCISYQKVYSDYLRGGMHPVNARELAIASVTSDFIDKELIQVPSDQAPALIREQENNWLQ